MTNHASAFSHIADYYSHQYLCLDARGFCRRKDCWVRLRLLTMEWEMKQAASGITPYDPRKDCRKGQSRQ
jgi:hypothetical protein